MIPPLILSTIIAFGAWISPGSPAHAGDPTDSAVRGEPRADEREEPRFSLIRALREELLPEDSWILRIGLDRDDYREAPPGTFGDPFDRDESPGMRRSPEVRGYHLDVPFPSRELRPPGSVETE